MCCEQGLSPISLSDRTAQEFLPEKIYRLKEDQAFSLSLELSRRENLRGINRHISSPPPILGPTTVM
jgi:hypothetical protein